MTDAFGDLRGDYDTAGIEPGDLSDDPIEQARLWLEEAIANEVPQANAASLATATASGRPSVRTVLLKEMDRGFVVYTNYDSRKSQQLEENPRAALSLTWVTLHRQIRVEGSVERVAAEQSDAYFASRPRGAQLAAIASSQSAELPDRTELQTRFDEADARHPGEVPRPPYWGGYRIVPDRVEFWQGRRNRLHDRIEYLPAGDGWTKRRLSP